MMSYIQGSSSGSEMDAKYADQDEKKRRRMISNRESARRSRMKKQKRLQDLTGEMGFLERQKHEIIKAYNTKVDGHLALESENNALLAEKMALTNYLNNMELMIENLKQKESNSNKYMPPELQEPWQVHSPSNQMMTSSSSMFRI